MVNSTIKKELFLTYLIKDITGITGHSSDQKLFWNPLLIKFKYSGFSFL